MTNPKPLNHYLLNEDVAKILCLIYKDSSKEELMNDEEIMQNFYGSAKVGSEHLGGVDDETWENLVEEMDDE